MCPVTIETAVIPEASYAKTARDPLEMGPDHRRHSRGVLVSVILLPACSPVLLGRWLADPVGSPAPCSFVMADVEIDHEAEVVACPNTVEPTKT